MATRIHGLYRLLDRPAPDAAHGGCYLTGDQGPCIDTGILIEQEGTLTIGLHPLKELCEVAGFSFDAEGIRTERRLAEAQRELEVAHAENNELREQLDAVALAVAHTAAEKPKTQRPIAKR